MEDRVIIVLERIANLMERFVDAYETSVVVQEKISQETIKTMKMAQAMTED